MEEASQVVGERGRRLRFKGRENPYERLALAYGRDSLFSLLSLWFLAAVFLCLAQTPLIRGNSYWDSAKNKPQSTRTSVFMLFSGCE